MTFKHVRALLPIDCPCVNLTSYTFTYRYYLSYESEAVWKALYTQPELHGYFAASWAAVAAALKDAPGLLGYELLNEPWPSGAHELSDAKTLLPMYKRLYAAIRATDANHIVFFEPLVMRSYEEDVGLITDFPLGGVGGVADVELQAYAYHLYCAPSNNTASMAWKLLCDYVIDAGWRGVKRSLKKVGVGGFMTEFGAVDQDPGSMAAMELMADKADELLQSWSYWTYKSFDDITTQNAATETFFTGAGGLQLAKLRTLSRPYPQTVAGTPSSLVYNKAEKMVQFAYTPSTGEGMTNRSSLYIPLLTFSSTPTIFCSPGVIVEAMHAVGEYGLLVELEHTERTVASGGTLEVQACSDGSCKPAAGLARCPTAVKLDTVRQHHDAFALGGRQGP